MTAPSFQSWQAVQDEVLRRIHAREWKPGEFIPNEADLASEFGCARATVNRALRALADTGLLDRRRKAGTRVAAQPVAKATLDIAIIRHEIEERGSKYGHHLIQRQLTLPPPVISATMLTGPKTKLLHLRALHLADDTPYALEDRWINIDVVPTALDEAFVTTNANEWLLEHVPYTHGDIVFSATRATKQTAEELGCSQQDALLTIDRLTWDNTNAVTKVRLLFRAGHKLRTRI